MFKNKTKPTNDYLGIFDTPQDDGNDSDFEAELAALNSASGNNYPKKSVKPKVVNDVDFNNMVAQSLRDTYSSDDDLSDNDEDDPALLKELQDITGEDEEDPIEESTVLENNVSPNNDTATETMHTLEQRIAMYELAEKNAKTAGDISKSRRFGRGLKTLNDLLKQTKAGKTINIEDIPPEVSTKLTGNPKEIGEPEAKVTRPAPPVPTTLDFEKPEVTEEVVILSPTTSNDPEIPRATSQHDNPIIKTLNERLSEYKAAALKAKKDGDKESALQFIKVVKQFNVVINMALNGETVDLSDMPPPPDQFKEFLNSLSAQPESNEPEVEPKEIEAPVQNTTLTLLEALLERLSTYRKAEEAAKTEGNSGKVRRLGRIIKQYEDAIKLHKAGKAINKEELPTPPGFGPLPDEG